MRLRASTAPVSLAILLCFVIVSSAATSIGDPAPALQATELNGQQFDLSAERGKVVLVNFWVTWCPPCRDEMPMLDDFYREYHSKGLDMIGISVDSSHDQSDVVKVMKSLSYPAAMENAAMVNGFGTPDQLPVTYVIDRVGIIRAIFTASDQALSKDELETQVLRLLGKSATPASNAR